MSPLEKAARALTAEDRLNAAIKAAQEQWQLDSRDGEIYRYPSAPTDLLFDCILAAMEAHRAAGIESALLNPSDEAIQAGVDSYIGCGRGPCTLHEAVRKCLIDVGNTILGRKG